MYFNLWKKIVEGKQICRAVVFSLMLFVEQHLVVVKQSLTKLSKIYIQLSVHRVNKSVCKSLESTRNKD